MRRLFFFLIITFISCKKEIAINPVAADCSDPLQSDILALLNSTATSNAPQISIKIKERSAKAVLVADKAWESSGINYTTVLKDGSKWKMWYESFDSSASSDFDTYLCYAESIDGISWKKPELNLVKYKGSNKNNIVLAKGFHGTSIFYDENADLSARYKLVFTMPNETDGSWIYGMSSPDGIKFGNTVLLVKTYSDTQTSVIYDQGKYRLYSRLWEGGKIGYGRRFIGYTESLNFGVSCFPKPEKILALINSYDRDLYNNAISKLKDNLYIMLPSFFYYKEDVLIPKIATSADGINFSLTDEVFLSLGSGFDSKQIIVCPIVIQGTSKREFIIYYLGKAIDHSVDFNQIKGKFTGGIGRLVIEIN